MNNLAGLDLNLLKTLDLLLSERNVTRAAQRLHLSQPSVSVQLARLRAHFHDPLLIPGPGGMVPTSYAEALHPLLHDALEHLSLSLSPPALFAAHQAEITWRVAASDYGECTIVLPLLAPLRRQAPLTRLAVMEMVPSAINNQLVTGAVDLSIMTRDEAPERMQQQTLFADHYVLAARNGHPALTGPISLRRFCELEFVVVSQEGAGFVTATDLALQRAGLQRQVALSVPHFCFVPPALLRSDLVAMLPSRLVDSFTDLQTLPAPIEIAGFEMLMVWHQRRHHDPAHQWLRRQIIQATKQERASA